MVGPVAEHCASGRRRRTEPSCGKPTGRLRTRCAQGTRPTWRCSTGSPMKGSIEGSDRLRLPLLRSLESEAGDRVRQGPSGARDANRSPELRRPSLYLRLAVHDEADRGEHSSRRTLEGDGGLHLDHPLAATFLRRVGGPFFYRRRHLALRLLKDVWPNSVIPCSMELIIPKRRAIWRCVPQISASR